MAGSLRLGTGSQGAASNLPLDCTLAYIMSRINSVLTAIKKSTTLAII